MLTIDHLVKRYDGFTLECSLELMPGRVTGLIGRNGAGKSTMFKAVLGLIHMDSGSIEIMGRDLKRFTDKDRQKLGVALSDSGFSSYLSVKDISCILKSMYAEYDEQKFYTQCQHFKLPLDKRLKEFSTGMKAKLKLLIAMCHKASMLILDEPTVGLDVTAREEMLDMLRGYMEEDESRSILISSHISSDLEGLCDDFYMIEDGKIVLHEETDVLLSDYALLKLTPEQYEKIDKNYLISSRESAYGYACLTNQKQFYRENYPEVVMEKGKIDDLILIMTGGAEA